MFNTKIIAFIGLSLINSLTLARPSDHHNPVLRKATKESAIEFVEQYYGHLNRGMTRKQLSYYWTDRKVEELDGLTFRMAEITGKDLAQESQRLMDLSHMEARCEDLLLANVKTYGTERKTAKLNYNVNYTCASWKKPSYRTITLRFSMEEEHWLINKIEDGE